MDLGFVTLIDWHAGAVLAITFATFWLFAQERLPVQSTALLWNHTFSDNTYSWSDATRTQAGTVLPAFTKTWKFTTRLVLFLDCLA